MEKLIVAAVPEIQKVIPYTLAILLVIGLSWLVIADLIKRAKVVAHGAGLGEAVPALQTRMDDVERDLKSLKDDIRIQFNDFQTTTRMANGESSTNLWNFIRALEKRIDIKDAIEKDRNERS